MSTALGRYALIIGNGRSGTNWLLTMLDASRLTHCRNEPQEIKTSPYHQLPMPPLEGSTTKVMAAKWDEFVTWTAMRMGERDLQITHPKDHIHVWAQKTGIAYLPVRPKVQQKLRPFVPALQRGEWLMPPWMGHQARLQEALAVLKVNDLRAWAAEWLFQHRPHVPIIHITRHPGGQLNSGIKRFFSHLSPAEQAGELHLHQRILQIAAQLSPEWGEKFGDIEAMALIEAVAWVWRYNNEMIYLAGQQAPNYLPIVYEDLTQAPLHYARKMYDLCQLSWTSDVENIISQSLGTSVWGKLETSSSSIADAWKHKLAPEYQMLANKVLEGSLMKTWWTGAN
ncbi:MAG: sulfotransferase [Cyanobacteria bacterium P01_F01_bin.86]